MMFDREHCFIFLYSVHTILQIVLHIKNGLVLGHEFLCFSLGKTTFPGLNIPFLLVVSCLGLRPPEFSPFMLVCLLLSLFFRSCLGSHVDHV